MLFTKANSKTSLNVATYLKLYNILIERQATNVGALKFFTFGQMYIILFLSRLPQ